MTKKIILSSLALGALILTGCAQPSVVGKWQGTQNIQSPVGNQSLSVTTEYKADNTFNQSVSTPMGSISVKGTYKLEGDKMTSSLVSLDAPPMIKTLAEPALKKQINQTVTYKVTGDALTLSTNAGGKNDSLTLNRVKE
jgi:hypothetical protein